MLLLASDFQFSTLWVAEVPESEQKPWYHTRVCAVCTQNYEQNCTSNNSGNEYNCYRHYLLRKLGDV